MNYKELAENLVKKCQKNGADAAEIYIESERNLNVEIRNGEVETVQESTSNGCGFRVFVGGKMAFSHCNDFSDEALENTIKSAVGFARITTADENNVLPDEKGITDVGALYDPKIAGVSLDQKIRMAVEAEKEAMKDARITKSAGAAYGEGENEITLANSNGLLKSCKISSCYFGVSVVAEKVDQKSSGGEYCSRRFFDDLKPIEEVAAKAAKDAYEMLDPRMVKTQKVPVVFDPDVARALLGGILAAVNGERVLQGASFLGKKSEQQIGSELLTLIDDGTRPKGLGTTPFDGEGVPTQKRTIIQNGILKGFMYNTIVAKRAGVKSTGNASRRGFTSLPGIGAHNFFMEAGKTPPENIINATKTGLYLKGVTGYGINPVNGNFSGGASGFWIENGKLSFPVKGLTIAGTADEMLNGIDMVGTDLDLNRAFTAPTFRIKLLQIGGK
ncbi:MAG: TldD/PmbA family protein [Candidatus Aminicenantes bacterium]|nr:TldD/PmbA family protein [Candidatus Aminicenantes bacterium]